MQENCTKKRVHLLVSRTVKEKENKAGKKKTALQDEGFCKQQYNTRDDDNLYDDNLLLTSNILLMDCASNTFYTINESVHAIWQVVFHGCKLETQAPEDRRQV